MIKDVFSAVVREADAVRLGRRAKMVTLLDWDHTTISNDSEELVLHAMVRRGMPGARERFVRYYELLDKGEVEAAYRVGAQLFTGMTVEAAETFVSGVMAEERAFPGIVEEKIFGRTVTRGIAVRPCMRQLIGWLSAYGIEVWAVTASPEILVRRAIRDFELPITKVVGNRCTVCDRIITDQLEEPVCMFNGKIPAVLRQMEGKETVVLSMGDSTNDEPLLRYFGEVKAVIDRGNALAATARREGWHILRP